MRKKFLAIDQGEYIGGAEKFFAELMTKMSEKYEINLITDNNQNYQQLYQGYSVRIYETPLPKLKPISWKTYRQYRIAQKNLNALLDRIKPDVIISNTVRTHLICSKLAKKLHIPLVWMAHDKTFPKLLLWHCIKYPDLIVACSEFVKTYYSKKSHKIQLLYPYGIDEEALEKYSIHPKQNIVGVVGNFIPWKGQDFFIRSIKIIHEKYPEYRFVLIGNSYKGNKSSENYFTFCKNLIKKQNVENICEIKSNVRNVFDEISKWKVLVHCSLESEPLGRVIFEGLSAGCAVVASRLGGPSEIIAENESGLLITPNETNISSSILCILSSLQLQSHFANAGREYIKHHFLWKNVLSNFCQMIDHVMR